MEFRKGLTVACVVVVLLGLVMKDHIGDENIVESSSSISTEECSDAEIKTTATVTLTPISTPTPVITEEASASTTLETEVNELSTEETSEESIEYVDKLPTEETYFEETDWGMVSEEVAEAEGVVEQQLETYLGIYTVTFYCPCPEHCNSWVGARGTQLTPWVSCATSDSLPFGTVINVTGFGEVVVEDRGVGDGCIDIFVSDHSEIPSYGMTTAEVYLVE
jgi:3D (Asp-Asp-Asp) domain-containing protein